MLCICQAAQANATTQARQRVCLFHRTTKPTDKPTDEVEHRTGNNGFAKWRLTCFYDSLVQGSSSVFQINICAENPPLRQAAGPLGINLKDRNMKSLNKIFWFGLTISIIMSCAVTKDYERAVTTNSISAFENYNYKMQVRTCSKTLEE